MKLKTGDTVIVIAGKDRNKIGKVLRVVKKSGRVVVEGINKVVRHMKKTKQRAGQKVTFEAPLHASNVMLLDPKTKKATRVGYKISKDGKKERIAKKSQTII
ncbi:50S ribosomal protein L24 [Candidatus Peregrinibacteria bacterium RIFCSPLOWO2_02_FULL_48_14]|nr:MAG: 50S ribosomal protein L24 [Candidatus Peregrinibacteria bacterium RIFCSPLOWO2_02_FULL_48_14]